MCADLRPRWGEPLRRHTLQWLERCADSDWVISDLVPMECLVGPLRADDQIRLLVFRAFQLAQSPIEVPRLAAELP